MYTIEQLSAITALTTRTLRSYLKTGILRGSKENGAWRFSEEQVSAFLNDPAVRPSIRAKQNAILYDFQSGYDCAPRESCVLLNLEIPQEEACAAAAFFCEEAGHSAHIRFSYSYEKNTAHFILKGEENEIRGIMGRYYRR